MKIIAAIYGDGVIGIDRRLPRRDKEDMARFRRLTKGAPCAMGMSTFLDDLSGSALPGRPAHVLSSASEEARRAAVSASTPAPVTFYDWRSEDEVQRLLSACADGWCIGGGRVYEMLVPYVDELHLSLFASSLLPPLNEGSVVTRWLPPPYVDDGWRRTAVEQCDTHVYTVWTRI